MANAVLDGADAIMLGAETLRGMFAPLTVETVRRICCEAEKVFDFENHYQQQMPQAVMDSGLLSQNEAGLSRQRVSRHSPQSTALAMSFT